MKKFFLCFIVACVLMPLSVHAANFNFKKVSASVYAGIAVPGGKAASNCMIIVTDYQVILAGAHFVTETTKEILAFIKTVTPIPVRYIILTHHHRGFNYIDFDLPANAEIIASGSTWQSLKSEFRQIKNQVTFFDRGMSMKRNNTVIILTATEAGHSEGDVFVYLPDEAILFTSDLFYNDVAGYMGDGHFREWISTLELLAAINSTKIIPGLGDVTDSEGVLRFQAFFRDFATEVLRVVGKGLDIEAAKREFKLLQYEAMPGFKAFFDINFRRAFKELKELK